MFKSPQWCLCPGPACALILCSVCALSRNVLAESARIARGKITNLAQLKAANHDAAIFPGGFGAAKNLCVSKCKGLDHTSACSFTRVGWGHFSKTSRGFSTFSEHPSAWKLSRWAGQSY